LPWPSRLERGGEQVAGSEAAVGSPLVGDGQDFLLGGEVVELVCGPDRLAEREIGRQNDIFPLKRDDQGQPHLGLRQC
jgi:hypothetical protein